MSLERSHSHRAYIAVGANLGERRTAIDAALHALRATLGIGVEKHSSLIETKAVGGPDGQPDYLNGAAELATSLLPRELLQAMMEIEVSLGRDRSNEVRNGPRTIDLDLLLYDDLIIANCDLIVPHPRMHERDFVLMPMVEIGPQVVHPVLGKTIEELWRDWRRDRTRL